MLKHSKLKPRRPSRTVKGLLTDLTTIIILIIQLILAGLVLLGRIECYDIDGSPLSVMDGIRSIMTVGECASNRNT